MYMNTHRLQRGFSLVEVFVALLILSVGLIALAKLQVDLVRGSADARTRTIALSLAEEKVEDLRTFAVTDGTGSWSTAASPMAWSYIAANAGGRIASQPSYSSTLEVAGVRFLRTWTAADRNFTNVASGITARTKDVTVTVSWANEAGVTQSVNTVANVVEIPPGNVGLASEPVASRPAGPQVSYTPGLAPDIISINIGGGKKRETTKPLPDVVGNSGTNVVSFDVVNYNSSNKVTRREGFRTINCGCNIDTAGPARTPAHWTYVGNLLRETPGVVVTKTRGSYSANGQGFDDLCVVCCRDHHDYSSGGTDYRYNPTDTSNHLHYKRQNNGTYTAATSVGDAYDEACRLKRINGVFQVFEDWNLQAVNVMPATDLVDGTSTQTAYKGYIADLVRKYVDSSQTNPVVPTFSTTTMAPAEIKQIEARVIYIDYMTSAQKAAAAARITVSDNQSVLEAVPWYEVNLTKIANWKLQQINSNTDYVTVSGQNCGGSVTQATLAGYIACVANQAIVDESVNQNNYFRGQITAGPVAGTLDVQGYLRTGNTGVTGTNALTAASDTATPVSSEYRFSNVVATPAHITGFINKGTGVPNNPWASVSCSYTVNGGSATTCAVLGNGNGNKTFDITTVVGASVQVTITYTGHTVSPPSATNTAPTSGVTFTLNL